MGFVEEIAKSDPRDIYELSVLVHDVDEAMEFLVRQCQEKNRIILMLSRALQRELGNGMWTRYAQDVLNAKLPVIPVVPPDNVLPLPVRPPQDIPL